MRLLRYHDAAAFRERAQPFLMEAEAANCVMLGICATLVEQPEVYANPFLAVAEDVHGAVGAVFIRTPPHALLIGHRAAPEALRLAAQALLEEGDAPTSFLAVTTVSAAFADLWRTLTGKDVQRVMAERAYQTTAARFQQSVAGHARLAAADDFDLIVEWHIAFEIEAFAGSNPDRAQVERRVRLNLNSANRGTMLWVDTAGQVVTLVGFGSVTPRGIRIGPVYTPPEQRRRGYATACTAAATQYCLTELRREFVFLFTDLSNATANHIYPIIGYEPVSDLDMYRIS